MTRTLVYDIETAPSLGWYFDRYREGNIIKGEAEWYILCFAYKWLGEKQIHAVALPDFDLYDTEPENDLGVVTALRDLFDEADVTITHNGKTFDHRKANTRMVVHQVSNGLVPPSPHREIDTLQIARRQFAFTSNRLGDLCQVLGLPAKGDPGRGTWFKCMEGDPAAWKRMIRYNKQDVRILERIYEVFKPWAPTHPGLHDVAGGCPRCGHKDLMARGFRYTQATKRHRYQCKRCLGYVTDNKIVKLETEYRPI